MSIVSNLLVRSHPSRDAESIIYHPSLPTGARFRILEGPVPGSGYWWYRVGELSETLDGGATEGWLASADVEGKPWIGPSPDACTDLPFEYSSITVSSFADLQAGVVDSWAGCVFTPWVPPYWVTVTLRDDGTYSAHALVNAFVDPGQPAFYYGTDEDSPFKQYAVLDFQESGLGIGQIDIYFFPGSVNRGDLRNIRLMGDQLEFEFFHRSQYGPLTYRLYRIGTPD